MLGDGLVQPRDDHTLPLRLHAVNAAAQARYSNRHEGHKEKGEEPGADPAGVAIFVVDAWAGSMSQVFMWVRYIRAPHKQEFSPARKGEKGLEA